MTKQVTKAELLFRATFRVDVTPTPKGRPRVTRQGVAYTPAATRRAEQDIILLAAQHRPQEPLYGPVRLRLVAVLPVPASWPSWRQDAAGREWVVPTGPRSDVDNLAKTIMDGLTRGGWWRDDGQITALDVRKRYVRPGERPGTEVTVEELAAIRTAAEWRTITAEYRQAAGGGA